MAPHPDSLVDEGGIKDLSSVQEKSFRGWDEDVERHRDTDLDKAQYSTRPWSPGKVTQRKPVAHASHKFDVRTTEDVERGPWRRAESGREDESIESLYPKPLIPQRPEDRITVYDTNARHSPNYRPISDRSEKGYDHLPRDFDTLSPNTRGSLQRQNEQCSPSTNSAQMSKWPNKTDWSVRIVEDEIPIHDSRQSYANTIRPQPRRNGQRDSSMAHELDASPISNGDSAQRSPRVDAEDYMLRSPDIDHECTTSIRPSPQSVAASSRRTSFRTNEDEIRAQGILSQNKDVKIEKRSSLRRFVMPKSKRTSFSQREIFRAIHSVVNGNERAGPGVVEVLLVKFLREGGDINLVPPPSNTLGISLKKRQEERSGLLEKAAICGDVEVVQLLSPYSDKTAKNQALEIALQNRNTTTGRDITRDDQIIYILVSEGADVDNTISAAVSAGEEGLLRMLLEGSPPVPALSEALPIAVANRDTLLRRRLSGMLLRKGADVNSGDGESILLAAKLFDMVLLDMLLERRPFVSSLNRAFAAALSYPESNRRFEACLKLIDAGATGEEVDKGLITAIASERQNLDFLQLILRSASVDFDNAHVLCQTVTNNYPEHLKLILAKRPNEKSFDLALETALVLKSSRDQLKFCQLLVGAGPPRDSCSKALLVAVTSQKGELCRLFLEARASVDYDGGAAITAAARSENIGILELLLGREFQLPQNSSLVPAFELSLTSPSPSAKKMKVVRLILDAGLNGEALDVALVNATKLGQDGVAMCELLLKYGASISVQDGEALDVCTRAGNLDLLEKLLQSSHRPSAGVLSRIFQSSLKLDRRIRFRAIETILQAGMTIDHQVAAALDGFVQEKQPDMQAINVLLRFHTSVHYEAHRPLITAAKNLDQPLFTLFLEHSRDMTASSKIFEVLMSENSFWAKREAFSILTLLLENGASGIAVDDALIKAVKDGQPKARNFEIVLLQHANIDHKDGMALQIATERGEPALVRRMLTMKPAPDSVSMAFPYVLVSKLPEATCLALIEAFVEMASDDLYPDYMHFEVPEPPVFLCLHRYPNSLIILEATLNAGFHVDQEMSAGTEKLTALYWALTEGKNVGDHLVDSLISRGANLDNHPEPLLNLAIQGGRHSIVQALIKAGADVDLADEDQISPLSLATQKQDIVSMKALIAAKALANDGSLHDAARMINVEAMKLLLDNGHDANFSCPRFEGRPPLFELCLHAPAQLLKTPLSTQQKLTQAKRAIETLIKGGALTKDRLPRAGNRSVLIHALDSANPNMMTRAFLECGQFKYINRDFNLYMDSEFTYSPTKYVEKGKSRGDNSQSQSVVTLLKDFGADDRYWRITGPQPPDMVKAPEHIVKAENERKEAVRRKKEEEEERRREIEKQDREATAARKKLALEQEAEQARMDREHRQFQLRQAHEEKLHAAAIAKENDRLRIQEAKSAHALKQAASLSRLRNDEDEARHRRSMGLIKEKKILAQSQEALYFAYNKGVEDAVGPGGRRALGPSSSRSNLDLAGRARQRMIEGGHPSRIEELDE